MIQNLCLFFSLPSVVVELLAILWFFTKLKMHNIPRACTIKHYVLIMYVFLNKLMWLFKLVCLSKPVKVTNNKNYFEIYPFYANKEAIIVCNTGLFNPCCHMKSETGRWHIQIDSISMLHNTMSVFTPAISCNLGGWKVTVKNENIPFASFSDYFNIPLWDYCFKLSSHWENYT